MVPIDHILESTPESIRLNCTREDMSKLPIFKNEHNSVNELAIRRGASVEATDGRVGRVDEFF